ncbi:hypothetical protein MTR67_043563, partial [Solanum verrucosum]
KLKNPRDPNPNLEDETLLIFADQLIDLAFGVVHRRLAPAFSIVVLWFIGRHGIASRNFSVMRRLLPFSADLILSFMAQHWNKRRSKTLRRLANWTRQSSRLHFFILFSLFVPFCDVVSMLSYKPQISEI